MSAPQSGWLCGHSWCPDEQEGNPLLADPWRFFRLAGADGQEHLFYRCPGCGAALDWRDHDLHLRFHGIMDPVVRAEATRRQEGYAAVRGGKPQVIS